MKREIFSELVEGFDALANERQGKITLRTHKVQLNKLSPLTAEEVVAVRQQLNLSRSVFAMYLRTNTRTLENWEQGRAKPNAQVITGYGVRLSQRLIDGGLQAYVGITVQPRSGKEVVRRLSNMAQVQQLCAVSGEFDYVAWLRSESPEQLDQLLDQIGSVEGVEKTTTSIILSSKVDRG